MAGIPCYRLLGKELRARDVRSQCSGGAAICTGPISSTNPRSLQAVGAVITHLRATVKPGPRKRNFGLAGNSGMIANVVTALQVCIVPWGVPPAKNHQAVEDRRWQ